MHVGRTMGLLAVLGFLCLGGSFYLQDTLPVMANYMYGESLFFFACMIIYAAVAKYDKRKR